MKAASTDLKVHLAADCTTLCKLLKISRKPPAAAGAPFQPSLAFDMSAWGVHPFTESDSNVTSPVLDDGTHDTTFDGKNYIVIVWNWTNPSSTVATSHAPGVGRVTVAGADAAYCNLAFPGGTPSNYVFYNKANGTSNYYTFSFQSGGGTHVCVDDNGHAYIIAHAVKHGSVSTIYDWYIWQVDLSSMTQLNAWHFVGDATQGQGSQMVYDALSNSLLVQSTTGYLFAVDCATGTIRATSATALSGATALLMSGGDGIVFGQNNHFPKNIIRASDLAVIGVFVDATSGVSLWYPNAAIYSSKYNSVLALPNGHYPTAGTDYALLEFKFAADPPTPSYTLASISSAAVNTGEQLLLDEANNLAYVFEIDLATFSAFGLANRKLLTDAVSSPIGDFLPYSVSSGRIVGTFIDQVNEGDPSTWIYYVQTLFPVLPDGPVFAYTDHDKDIVFEGVTYRAQDGLTSTADEGKSDMTPDNQDSSFFPDDDAITERDVRGKLFDSADVEVRVVNWADLSQGAIKLRKGTTGTFTLTRGTMTTQVRGLLQKLANVIGDTYGPTCRAQLGDSKCTIDMGLFSQPGTVSASVDGNTLTPEAGLKMIGSGTPASDAPTGWFDDGILTFNSGENAGLSYQIGTWDGTDIVFRSPMLAAPQAGDSFTILPGCNHSADPSTGHCQSKYNNILNFRGEPFIPGERQIRDYPDAVTS